MRSFVQWFPLLSTIFVACLSIVPAAAAPDSDGFPYPLADNQVLATVRTPISGFNRITVAVEICAPGSTTKCQRIENIMVDTGSTGLRIQRTAISPNLLGLTSPTSIDNLPLAECEHFSGKTNDAWGSIRLADVGIAHLRAHNLAIQIVNDESVRRPSWCENTTAATSNGTLGIGWRLRDPTTFVGVSDDKYINLDSTNGLYHLVNPVTKFAIHDNGEVFDFPNPGREGEAALNGTITFGVNTANNNQIKGAEYLPLDENGLFTTTFAGSKFPKSYIDSGTPAFIFRSPAFHKCKEISNYYDDSVKLYTAVLQENPAATILDMAATPQPDPAVNIPFILASRSLACHSRHSGVVGGLAEVSSVSDKFVWGLPFFLGRRVFLVQEQATINAAGSPVNRGQVYAVMPSTSH